MMNVTIPDAFAARLTQQQAALHLAIGLFVSEEFTLGQAAEIAGLSQTLFLRELGARHIPMHYGVEEFAEDLRTLDALGVH